MWHEARRQERKIRGMLVDYRKRAERRRDFYEKIKADPTQFLQVHGRQCKVHLDPAIAAAADSAVMMPWQGNANNLIDRFDVRAHLDYIPAVSKQEQSELTQEERHLNYERYRIIAQNAYLGISEEKFLKQLHLEEQFGYTENKTRKEPKGTGAAIGFNYEDGTAITAPSASNDSPEENFDDENSDSDLDVDLAINVSKIDSTQAHEMNKHGQHFGMAGNDFYSFLTNDMEEAESYKLAKEEEHEKALFSGRKSRRERRAHREKRLANRKISPPSYAAKESPTNPSIKEDSKSPSRSPSPDAGKITYITSFGDDEEPQSSMKQTYADKVKYGKKHNPSSDRLIYFGNKSRSSSREVCYLKRKRSHSRSRRSRSCSQSRKNRNRRLGSRSPSRRSRYNYSNDRSRSSPKRAKSFSRSRSRSYNKRKSSSSRSRSISKTNRSTKSSRSRSRCRWSRSASPNRRSRSRSQHSSKPYRRRSTSSSSLSSSSSSLRSRSRSKSPMRQPNISRSKSKTPVPPSPPRIIRYYGRRKSDQSSSESSSSDDSEEMKPANPVSSDSKLQSGNNSGIASKRSTTLSVIERLKLKRQALINRQFKRDKIAEVQKLEREKQEQQTREDELREMAIKLRRRQREKRHAYDRSSSSDSDKSNTSRTRDRSSSPKSREKDSSRNDVDKEDREKRSRSRDRSRRKTRDRSRDAERRRSRSRSHRYDRDKEEKGDRRGKSPESKEATRKLVDY